MYALAVNANISLSHEPQDFAKKAVCNKVVVGSLQCTSFVGGSMKGLV